MIRSWPDDKKIKSAERGENWMKVPIVFPPLSVEDASDEPLIIEAVMEGYSVRRVYVDQGASLEVMFEQCFKNLSPTMRSQLRSTQMDLVGFARGVVNHWGRSNWRWSSATVNKFKSSPSGFLNNTLHDKVSHSKMDRNFGHSDNGHCRVPEDREEANGRKRKRSEHSSGGRRPEESGFDRANISQSGISESASYDRGKPVGRVTRCAKKKSYGIRQTPGSSQRSGRMDERRNSALDKIPYMDIKPGACKKGDRSWRMCIDFKNLNSACPKDYYPLSDIDEKIESVVGFRYKCFLDAYKGYHQVQMALDDEEKTTFYTDHGMYCYTKMSFKLKNAGAIYQRLVDTAFQSQIRRSLEAYVDDMVIKSNDEKVLIADIAETFDNLRRINMKDITKENKDEYRWTKNAEKAFHEIKKFIVELPLLTTPVKEETLYVYLTAATEAVSAVLLTERKGKQCPIHYEVTKLAKYLVELGAYNITYEPRNAIKGQIVAGFLSEALVGTPTEEFFRLAVGVQNKDDVEKWTLFTDGASNSKGSRAGLVLISPSGVEFTYALHLNFTSTNNEAEYEALLARLCMARKMKVEDINVKVDSKLVASQINRSYVASSTSMIKYLAMTKECMVEFKSFAIQNIPKNLNHKADILSKLATHALDILTKKVLVEVLAK
ncbi:reverse transcriptase domain-containing protein [Tanacetum coccineum]